MKNSRMKKLTLNKETLRNLQDSQLGQVVGGAQNVSDGCPPIHITPVFARRPSPPNMSDDCPATHYCTYNPLC